LIVSAKPEAYLAALKKANIFQTLCHRKPEVKITVVEAGFYADAQKRWHIDMQLSRRMG